MGDSVLPTIASQLLPLPGLYCMISVDVVTIIGLVGVWDSLAELLGGKAVHAVILVQHIYAASKQISKRD